MKKFFNDKLLPFLDELSGKPWVLAMRAGLIPLTLITTIASVFVIITSIPVPAYQNAIAAVKPYINVAGNIGMGCSAIVVTVGISTAFAKAYDLDTVTNNAIALYAFLITQVKDGALITTYFGSKGLFLGIVVALFTTFINYQFKSRGWTIKMPEGVPDVVVQVFQSMIAGFVVVTVIWVLTVVLGIDLNTILTTVLSPLSGLLNSAIGVAIVVFLMCLMWCIGLHESLFYGFVYPIAEANMAANAEAFLAGATGAAIPFVFTKAFLCFCLWLGGSGGTLGLEILLLTSKSKSLKSLGKIAAPSSLFQVNEPITFGVPVVFNPILSIPYCLFPAVAAFLTYTLMDLNIIGRTIAMASAQIPPIIWAYFATGGNIPAIIWYCIEIVISVLMYLPFFKVYEARRLKDEAEGKFEAE